MKKTQTTKRALLSSVLALILCMSMFVGTTFAWFTDNVTSAGNKIVAGNLKVDLELLDAQSGKWNSLKETNAPIFNYDNWEPGYTDVKMLKVENEGSLALKWKAMFVSDAELSALADVIDVYVLAYGVLDDNTAAVEVKYPADRDLAGYTRAGTVKEFVNTIETTTVGTLKAGESAYLGIALKMQESAGNAYQGLDLGEFDIRIVAAQLESETDSFDATYDKNAMYPGEVSTAEELANAIAAGGNVKLLADIDTAESIVVPAGVTVNLDLNGKTITGGKQADPTKSIYAIENKGTLTLKNATVNSRGVGNYGTLIVESGVYNAVDENGGAAIWNYAGSSVTINGGTFTGAQTDTAPGASAMHVASGATAVVNGGTFETDADLTYAIISSGNLTINNATVIGEHGAVAASEGKLTINDGYYEVTGTSTDHVIYAPNGGVIINGGTFKLSQTNASSLGSTIIDGAVTVNGGTFDSVDGALAYNGETGLVINGGTFLNKAATVYGGNFAQFVAATSTATTNADGSITVTPCEVSSADELADAIVNGTTAVSLSNDIVLNTQLDVKNDLIIFGNGKTITAPASGTRVVNVMDNTKDVSITLVDAKLDAADKERGISFYNNSGDLDVTIIDCEITANYYGVNVAGLNASATLYVKNSTLKGWCAFQTWSENTKATFDNCVLEGVNLGYNNNQYPYANNFATVVVNSDADNSEITFNNCTIIATEKESATAPAGQWPGTQAHIIDKATGTTINWNNCTFIKNGVEVNAPETLS